jgi:UDP-N-acetyl-D-galactosamine dehydrogenase
VVPRLLQHLKGSTDVVEQSDIVAVIGLGYVGLPLAVEFGKIRPVIGFDIDAGRISELQRGEERTREVEAAELSEAAQLTYSCDPADLERCDIFIVTVPTPIDAFKRPDLSPLVSASRTVGRALRKGGLVIYESTVYPGATEEDCVPVLEAESGLKFNQDFFVGYSPERINPGDKHHRLTTITKITAGSTPEAAERVDALYRSIVTAGTHKASSIRVAEAAKVIENTQRDLNIALVNELALIFEKMNIDTLEVLEAAGTKWNFLPFRPGLVGGHCISVDPYYLTHKAQALGYIPEVVLAGRRINDGMGAHVANRLVRALIKRDTLIRGARVLVLGLTFKENCPDLRNTRVIDVIRELQELDISVDVHDPAACRDEALQEYGVTLREPEVGVYDAVLLAVCHDEYRRWGEDRIRAFGGDGAIFFDLKSAFPRSPDTIRL